MEAEGEDLEIGRQRGRNESRGDGRGRGRPGWYGAMKIQERREFYGVGGVASLQHQILGNSMILEI